MADAGWEAVRERTHMGEADVVYHNDRLGLSIRGQCSENWERVEIAEYDEDAGGVKNVRTI